jgi:hypothetical protein
MRARGLEHNLVRDLFLARKTRRVRLWEPKFNATFRAVSIAREYIETQFRNRVRYGWTALITGGLLNLRGQRQCAQLVLDYTRELASDSDTIVWPDDFFTPCEIDRYYTLILEL